MRKCTKFHNCSTVQMQQMLTQTKTKLQIPLAQRPECAKKCTNKFHNCSTVQMQMQQMLTQTKTKQNCRYPFDMPRTLASAGYVTISMGKDHFGWNQTSDHGIDHGYGTTLLYDGLGAWTEKKPLVPHNWTGLLVI